MASPPGPRKSATRVFYRARWYDPSQGRFLSEDPAGFSGGLNLYAYAGNNPVLFNDPFGLSIGTFLEGLAVGVFEGIASAIVAELVIAGLTALTAGTGGAALAAALAILAAYGLYQIYEEAKSIAEIWDKCPDERDYRIGKLVGSVVGALLGGKALGGSGAGAGAGEGEAAGCPTCKGGESCFVAGTLVETSQGEKRIEEVRAGDAVLSSEPERADASVSHPVAHDVSRTFVRTSPVVLDIRVAGQSVTVTPEHPFWVVGVGWTRAGELKAGDLLLTEHGSAVRVESVRRREGSFRVFNFEVTNAHTYYVSRLGLLVHNQCDLPGLPDSAPEPLGRGSTGRTTPGDLAEQLAMEQARANPSAGSPIPLTMTDPRWPASDGWVKMRQNINGHEIHYVMNTITGAVDDFKFK